MPTQQTGAHEADETNAQAASGTRRHEAGSQPSRDKSHGSKPEAKARTHDSAPHYQSSAKNLTEEDRKFLEEHDQYLSKSTLRAKWIHSLDEHEDYPGQTLATRSHDVIKHWAEERQAVPATVPGTEHGTKHRRPGVLTFNFPGNSSPGLEEIKWDDWFLSFDVRQLVFLFQEHLKSGRQSNFFHLDSPEREHD